jgi:hypothetical protein
MKEKAKSQDDKAGSWWQEHGAPQNTVTNRNRAT